ncbi:hypothetical protein I3760_01G204600 [Carya illinoinensis]|nr:hypothetical protein I3760_01G204600 [Carya illinoinensis]
MSLLYCLHSFFLTLPRKSSHSLFFVMLLCSLLGIILKENGKVGDAERMFIQARFFAPENAKALVDRFARQ